MNPADHNHPLKIAQEKYTSLCTERYGTSPSKEQTKEVLQELIDSETDFAVKLAYTSLWALSKDYYSK